MLAALFAFFLAGFFLFLGRGMSALVLRWQHLREPLDPVLGSSLAVSLWVMATTLVSQLAFPAVFILLPLLWALILWGVFKSWKRGRPGVWLALGLGVYFLVQWAWFFRDWVGLPSHHDGIVHATFVMRILETGIANTARIPLQFSDVFGAQSLQFYPVGTHSLLAGLIAPWVWLGWLDVATALQGAQIFACAAAPLLLFYTLRRIFPGKWLGCAGFVSFLMMSQSIFPMWSVTQGGMMRVLALGLTLPVVAETLVDNSLFRRWGWSLGPLLFAAFFLHPSAALFLGSAVVLGAVMGWWRAWSFSQLGGVLFLVAGGGGLVAWILASQPAVALDANLSEFGKALPLSFGSWLERMGSVFAFTLKDPYKWVQTGFLRRLELKEILFGLGIVLWLSDFWSKRLPRNVRLYPVCMVAFSWLLLSLAFVPWTPARLIGMLFYHIDYRVAELMYLASAIILFWGVQFVVKSERWGSKVFVLLLAIALLGQVPRVTHMNGELQFFFAKYGSFSKEKFAPLASFIREHTPQNALLVYPRDTADILPAMTGRQGLFAYGECPGGGDSENCRRREQWMERVLLGRVEACLVGAEAFGSRPVFLVLPQDSGLPLGCLDRHRVFKSQDFQVVASQVTDR